MTKTLIRAPLKTKLSVIFGSLRVKIALVLGYLVSTCLSTYEGYKKTRSELYAGALSQEKIDEIIDVLRKLPRDYVDNQTPLSDEEVNSPLHTSAVGAKFIRDVILKHRSQIRTVVSIGGQHDQLSSYLASKFLDIQFTSMDFTPPEMLMDFNRLFPQSNNWTLKSGNALKMLRNGSLAADLIFMQSVGFLMNSKEIDQFINAFKGRAKFIAITEAWFPVILRGNPFKFYRPEEVHPTKSPITPWYGHYNLFQHNYIAKFESERFKVEISELNDSGNPQYMKLCFLASDSS